VTARDALAATRGAGWRLGDDAVALRSWVPDDVPWVVEACQDPEIPRWTLVPSPYGADDARAWLAGQGERLAAGAAVELAIVDPRRGDERLGAIGLTGMSWTHLTAEVGYWLAAPARGRGVTARAVALLAGWAFERLGMARLELLAHPDNAATQRVAERAGFTREGLLRSCRVMKGARHDFYLYSLLPNDPAAQARAGSSQPSADEGATRGDGAA